MNAAASPARTSVSKAVWGSDSANAAALSMEAVRLVRHACAVRRPPSCMTLGSLRRVLDQLLHRGEHGGGAVPLAGEPGVALRCGGGARGHAHLVCEVSCADRLDASQPLRHHCGGGRGRRSSPAPADLRPATAAVGSRPDGRHLRCPRGSSRGRGGRVARAGEGCVLVHRGAHQRMRNCNVQFETEIRPARSASSSAWTAARDCGASHDRDGISGFLGGSTSSRCWAAGDSWATRSAKIRSTLRPSGSGSGRAVTPASCARCQHQRKLQRCRSGIPEVLVTSWSRTGSANPGAASSRSAAAAAAAGPPVATSGRPGAAK